MAIRMDAAADRLLRTANLLTFGGPWTVMFWARLVTDLNAQSLLFYSGSDDLLAYVALNTAVDGVTLQALTDGNPTAVTGTVLVVGTDYHITFVRGRTADLNEVYVNGVLDITHTGSAGTPNRMEFGGLTTLNLQRTDGRFSAIKRWDAILKAGEMRVQRPVRTTNLGGWYPCLDATDAATDYSGLGRNFTIGGTLTTEASPPVAWQQGRSRRVYVPDAAPAGWGPLLGMARNQLVAA